MVHELPHELPHELRPHGIFADEGEGGAQCPHKKKKADDLKKLGNIRKMSNMCGDAV